MALSFAARKAGAVSQISKPARRSVCPLSKQRHTKIITAAAAPKSRAASAAAAYVWRVPAVSLLSAAAMLLAVTPDSQAADLALGAQVFNGNCAACHQGGRNAVIAEKTLDKAALEQYLDGGFNIEAIIYQVENGKGAMPAWADRLSEEEIQAVAEYVYKQASEGLWKY